MVWLRDVDALLRKDSLCDCDKIFSSPRVKNNPGVFISVLHGVDCMTHRNAITIVASIQETLASEMTISTLRDNAPYSE